MCTLQLPQLPARPASQFFTSDGRYHRNPDNADAWQRILEAQAKRQREHLARLVERVAPTSLYEAHGWFVAVIGPDLESGIVGRGRTPYEALRALRDEVEGYLADVHQGGAVDAAAIA